MKLTGFVYRAHNPKWAFAADSGQGAAVTGGRFNPVGMPTLYTARRFEAAWLEAQQAFPFKAQPMTLCAYEVDCEDILDLTNSATLVTYKIVQDDLAGAWKDLSTRGIKPPSLGNHGAACRCRHRRSCFPKLRQRGSRSGHQRGVLGLGAEPAAPGAGDR